MCGRVRLSPDVSEIKLVFSIPLHRPTPNIAPSWNVAPTDPVPIVRYDAKAGERSLDLMRWHDDFQRLDIWILSSKL
jgi:putative SOS response-associated peptidase YedK